jgi:3-hydroxyacyl-CoA dehydrogenase
MSPPSPKPYLAAAVRALGAVHGVPPGSSGREIRKVGIVGAGLMGSGIAVCFLGASIPTVLVDRTLEAVEKGRRDVGKALTSLVKRGVLWEDLARGLQELLTTTTDDAALADCDLIIEAVYERMEVKEAVFRRLGELARQGAVLATNTSGLDVDAIARASGRPADVLGLHFFSPAFMMPLLEIVRGSETAPEALRTALFAATIIRKTGIVVGNCPGFAANRTLEGYAREAERLVLEGVEPAELDRVMTAYGFPMGPCTMGDMAGIDVRAHFLAALKAEGRVPDDPRYGSLTAALAAAGRLGQKQGGGNYDYGADGRTPVPSPQVASLRDEVAARLGVRRRSFTDEEIVQRCLLPVINEAARVLEEGVVERASDIDVIWVQGYGFPAAKGGPVYQARLMGLDTVLAALEALRAADPQFGDAYWAPSPALPRLFA